MDREQQKIMSQLKNGISVKCIAGRNEYALEGYNLLEAIDILGMNGANPKSKDVLTDLFYNQLKEKIESTGYQGRVLTNSTGKLTFQYEDIFNKLFAFGLIEFYYNSHDDVEKMKLTDIGVEIYKAWKRQA